MAFDSQRPQRRSIRLKKFDYSREGAYFITICTQGRDLLFGDMVDGSMGMNDAGRMVHSLWAEMPAFYPGVETDEFIVMPNHIHGIIVLGGATPRGRPDSGQAQGPAPTFSVPDIVRRFKTLTTKRYIDGVRQSRWPRFGVRLWQRNYYEHVIHNEKSLNRVRQYILDNPAHWASDHENPDAAATQQEEDTWPQ